MRPTGGVAAQGAVSQARLVSSMYLIWGIAVGLGLPVELVVPQTWKAHYSLRGSDKELSRLRCLKLWPDTARHLTRKKDHNRAEAILLARYGQHLRTKAVA
jgi:crossover junction endodeoxyribonuclease RuvC